MDNIEDMEIKAALEDTGQRRAIKKPALVSPEQEAMRRFLESKRESGTDYARVHGYEEVNDHG